MVMNKLLMKYFRYFLVLMSVILLTFSVQAQRNTTSDTYKVEGHILSKADNQPLDMATLIIKGNNMWATANEKGKFVIPAIKAGKYVYEVSYLGYQKYVDTLIVRKNINNLVIKMDPLSLGLNEVVVTAQEQKMGSASKIDQTAIQHLQPKSIEDMLQLLPGNLTKNPNLSNLGQASVREISANDNNSLGVAVMVDGAPMSNDGNMQSMSTAVSGSKSGQRMNGMSDQTTGGRGIDLRTLSPDNIESIEVIRGIPSAEYGNLTSGVLVIKTKSGVTPWEAKVKVDPFSKMVYAGKGFLLPGKGGAMNFAADYSQSYADIRKHYQGYDRITANLGYSKTFMENTKPLTFNVRAMYYRNINSVKKDPQMYEDESLKNENTSFRLNIEGNWRLNLPWISNLSYSAMAQYSHLKDFSRLQVTLGTAMMPFGDSYVDKEYVGNFLQGNYTTEYTIDGKPLEIYAQLKGNKLFQFSSDNYTNIKVGVDFNLTDNNGNGMSYLPGYPISAGSGNSIRPRAYKDVPSMKTLSYFIEDRTEAKLGKTMLTVQGGVRFSNLFLDPLSLQNNIWIVEPRVNVSYQLLNQSNNRLFKDLSIVGGYGISSKAPTLMYLYPNSAYFDEVGLNRYNPNDPSQSMAIISTKVIKNTANPDLKPARSQKVEGGLAGMIGRVKGNVTFFYEKHDNEFSFRSLPYNMLFNKYTIPQGGTLPVYNDGVLSYIDASGHTQIAPSVVDTTMFSYARPSNSIRTIKRGIEYSFDFGQIPYIRTSLIVDGAWFYIKRQNMENSYSIMETSINNVRQQYAVLMPAGSGSINQRINTNFRFITHIPRLKMIFTTTAQVVWSESVQNIYKDKDGNDLFYHAVVDNGGKMEERLQVNPLGYTDRKNDFIPWNDQLASSSVGKQMISGYSNLKYYDKEKFSPYVMFNFRLTKEFGKLLELSFTANNFLKSSKLVKYKTRDGYRQMYTDLYFGAEIKIKI